MERFVSLTVILAMATVIARPAYAQVTTPCNASMINSLLNPCMNFLTNSSGNGTSSASPTADCCNSIKSVTSGGMDCLCLIVTGNLPFTIPINRTLAISLPRACNLPRLPLQCKASGSPIPAPGPAAFGPSLSPSVPPLSPQASSVVPSPSLAPVSDTTPPLLTPSSATTGGSGRSDLTPSSAISSYHLLPSVLLIAIGFSLHS
ncbi:non-specific lipid-transfer protein-like protein At5g64080 [Cajanus cajan]|uniref:Bifunctional inhibitor/plant lipid transfer protein/seed storage helical domain-containing protein n=1 Tax=Cajanus cajan TaxID=3821 RepID=A0A151SD65_CAJCA|nr:non-specific lipid-transfer protein-like protein At5g64080 [Cajanus cajan]KYP52726.1 hypothetical protein KK1_025471 [Cajanus cajan]